MKILEKTLAATSTFFSKQTHPSTKSSEQASLRLVYFKKIEKGTTFI